MLYVNRARPTVQTRRMRTLEKRFTKGFRKAQE
jgi:hypothetical protein